MAQAFSSVDTYLAPFVKVDNLSYEEVKQCIQSLIWGLNVSSRWSNQSPFSNFTIDWNVPDDLAEMPCVVGGKLMDFKYKDCQKEADMINKAIIEVMIKGDSEGRGFSYPILTYSITKDFDWSDTENNRLLFEMAAKYGSPYFANYVNSDMKPSDLRSMCCRLQLNLKELRKRNGGYFGSGDSTGSCCVVTINVPRIAYLAKDEKDFYSRLDHMLDISARACKTRRETCSQLMEKGFYPYSKHYLGTLRNHFSTIGVIGFNEACKNANWIEADMMSPKSQKFTTDVLNHINEKLKEYQQKYGDLYNCEAVPGESTCVSKDDYVLTTKGNIKVEDILKDKNIGIVTWNDEENKIQIKQLVDCWKTKENAEIEKITFTNGDSIKVTPNHKMAKRTSTGNGKDRTCGIEYVEAGTLKVGDRLFANHLYEKENGYYAIQARKGKQGGEFFVHRLLAEYYSGEEIPEGYVVHHKDYDKHNNSKDNLVIMSDGDHRRLHLEDSERNFVRDVNGESNPFYGHHHTEESNEKNRKWKKDHYEEWHSKFMEAMGDQNVREKMHEGNKKKTFEQYSQYNKECSTEKIVEQWKTGKTISEIAKFLGNPYTYSLVKSRLRHEGLLPNHQIAKIEYLSEREDVYDLEVEGNHNFFVSGSKDADGVLVHNCFRLAKHDKEKYPDIITANDHGDPYYTNSSHLPVNATDDLFEALDIEDPMQVLYTSGTVFHAFLGERLPNWKSAAMLVKKIAENYRLPYFTLSPTYSVCPDHGYINGEVYKCPKCGKETEVYSRITGYYRPVKNWNDGKTQEFKDRKTYSMGMAVKAAPHQYDDLDIEKEIQQVPVMIEQDDDHEENGHFKDDTDHIMLFTTKTCPNCKIIKEWLKNHNVDYSMIDAEENPELCEKYGIMQAPTMVISSNGGFKVYENVSNIIRHFQQD